MLKKNKTHSRKLIHTSFNLQAAGVTKPSADICPSVAEEALDQLMIRISSVERELQDFKFKVCVLIHMLVNFIIPVELFDKELKLKAIRFVFLYRTKLRTKELDYPNSYRNLHQEVQRLKIIVSLL